VIDAPTAKGTFSLQWAVDNATGSAISCDSIGGSTVNVTAHGLDVLGGTSDAFTCSRLSATSDPLPIGNYDIEIELDGMIGTLATGPEQHAVAIATNANTPLPPVQFTVDATGGLQLKISSGKAGGNCVAAPGGAGITGMSITLFDSTNTCVPVTFAVAADATHGAAPYVVNCTTPTVGPCIENDQTVSLAGIPSGNYTIHVVGSVAAAACYRNNDGLPVPPLGHDLTRTLNLAFQTGTPGC
jgi:hypothetical protein